MHNAGNSTSRARKIERLSAYGGNLDLSDGRTDNVSLP